MYTVEVAGQPTAVINASQEEIEATLRTHFRHDWRSFVADGEPPWLGDLSEIHLRPPLREEVEMWEEGFAARKDRAPGDGYLVFLRPVYAPADFTDQL